jgi:hypothetical protein
MYNHHFLCLRAVLGCQVVEMDLTGIAYDWSHGSSVAMGELFPSVEIESLYIADMNPEMFTFPNTCIEYLGVEIEAFEEDDATETAVGDFCGNLPNLPNLQHLRLDTLFTVGFLSTEFAPNSFPSLRKLELVCAVPLTCNDFNIDFSAMQNLEYLYLGEPMDPVCEIDRFGAPTICDILHGLRRLPNLHTIYGICVGDHPGACVEVMGALRQVPKLKFATIYLPKNDFDVDELHRAMTPFPHNVFRVSNLKELCDSVRQQMMSIPQIINSSET